MGGAPKGEKEYGSEWKTGWTKHKKGKGKGGGVKLNGINPRPGARKNVIYVTVNVI